MGGDLLPINFIFIKGNHLASQYTLNKILS